MKRTLVAIYFLSFTFLFSKNLKAQVNTADSLALVALYNSTDGANWTTSWDLTQPVSAWDGITIESGRVTEVSLPFNNLSGSIPVEIGSLGELKNLSFQYNNLSGQIPFELFSLINLEELTLVNNNLTGPLPDEIGNLALLKRLNLNNNEFGNLPASLSNLTELTNLNLVEIMMDSILFDLSAFTQIQVLSLGYNQLEGEIPSSIGQLSNLISLDLSGNSFSGIIPPELGQLMSLKRLYLSSNQLYGSLPVEITTIDALENLSVNRNMIDAIPQEISNLSNLTSLFIDSNLLTELPDLSMLPLVNFNVQDNRLEFDDLLPNASVLSFYSPQANIGEVQTLEVSSVESITLRTSTPDDGTNQYQWLYNSSPIPEANDSIYIINGDVEAGIYSCNVTNPSLTNFSLRRNDINISVSLNQTDSLALVALYNSTDGDNWTTPWDLSQPVSSWNGITIESGRVVEISMSFNNLSGSLPREIGNLIKLKNLSVQYNSLSGDIPFEFFSLINLEKLILTGNSLTGPLPDEMGNLTLLKNLSLNNNALGNPPASLSNLRELTDLNLSEIMMDSILFDLSEFTQLRFLSLSYNELGGEFPSSISQLSNLTSLNLSGNNFSGVIPPNLGQLTNLRDLYLSSNQFSGSLPIEISNIAPLETLWVGQNKIDAIPQEISNLTGLVSLLLDDNLVKDLPNLSTLTFNSFQVQGNKLEFDDILQNISVLTSYSPQEKINDTKLLSPEVGENLTLLVETFDDGNNTFQWYKDGNLIENATDDIYSFTYSATDDDGVYFCEVSNPALPDFSLIRKNIFVGGDITPVNPSDSLVLRKLYDVTKGDFWNTSKRWSLDDPVSSFEGVTISNERITELDLFNVGFFRYSTIPDDLLLLDSLSVLELEANKIRSIPDFSQLKTIDEINVSQNAIPVWDIVSIATLGEQGVVINYSNQENVIDQIDQIVPLGEEVTIKATFDKTVLKDNGSNIYAWFLDGELIADEADSMLVFNYANSDAGIYYCEVTHPEVEDVLTLSNNIRLNVVPTNLSLSNRVIRENLSIATEIGQLSTSDPEIDDTHTYEVLNSAPFFVAGNSLRSNAVFEYANQSSYSITIRSTDSRGLSIEKLFTIEILEEVKLETAIADFPGSGRAGAVSLQLGDDIYIGLGSDADSLYKDFWMYDASEETWGLIADFPGAARANSVGFVLDGKGYIGLGNGDNFSTLFSDVYQLDPSDNTWSQVSDFGGSARYNAVSFVVNNYAFVGTGKDVVDETKDFWKYDSSIDTWSQIADLSASQRNGAFAFSIEDKGYVGGGTYTDSDFFTEVFSDIQEYDPETDTWSEKIFADIDLSFIGASAVSAQGLGYVFYGNKKQASTYNPETNIIEGLDDVFSLDFARRGGISFVFGNKVYFGLGSYSESIFDDDIYLTDFYAITLPDTEENVDPSDIFLDNLSVNENIAAGKVGTLYAIDENATETHSFELVNGIGDDDNSSFTITNNSLNYSIAFDFEIQNEFLIRIRTTGDLGGSFEKTFIISAIDVNEEPTDLSLSSSEILEKQPVETMIGTLSTSDQDIGDIHTYEIISGGDEFYLSENNLHAKASFDFLEQSSYSVRIQTTDLLGKLFQKTFVITILSTNEVPTDILLSASQVAENQETNIFIGEFSTMDANLDDIHTYELVADESAFVLDGNQLFAKISFDFETKDEYLITISTTDQYGASFTKSFTITILDQEDPLGLEDNQNDITVFPNPATDFIEVRFSNNYVGEIGLKIIDVSGKEVESRTFHKDKVEQLFSIDIKGMNSGLFFIQTNYEGQKTMRRFVKR